MNVDESVGNSYMQASSEGMLGYEVNKMMSSVFISMLVNLILYGNRIFVNVIKISAKTQGPNCSHWCPCETCR